MTHRNTNRDIQGTDVGDRNPVQAELDESRQRLRLAANAAKLGWYSYDALTGRVVWSDELRMIVGLPPTEAVSMRRIQDLIVVGDQDRFVQHSRDSMRDEAAAEYRGEFRMRRGDGQLIWVEDRGKVVWGDRPEGRRPLYAVGMVMDVTERKDAEIQLRELNRTLEKQVADRTAILNILQDVTRAANEAQTVTEAMEAALERIASYNGWGIGHVWQSIEASDDAEGPLAALESSGVWHVDSTFDDRPEMIAELKRIVGEKVIRFGDGLIGRVAQSAQPTWVEGNEGDSLQHDGLRQTSLLSLVAFPITIDGEVAAVMEFLSDQITRPSEQLLKVIPDIGIQLGHVIERKRLERIVAQMAINEQQRIGRELHDGIAQQLTGGALIAQALVRRLEEQLPSQAATAKQLTAIIGQAHRGVRHLSSGLMLSTLSAAELLPALRAAAAETHDRFGIDCQIVVDSFDPSLIGDDRTALTMIQIAREAIHNAVKHSRAKRITLGVHTNDRIIMSIDDDGVGFDQSIKRKGGNGLRIMRYRAEAIGGGLSVGSQPDGGTRITFTLEIS